MAREITADCDDGYDDFSSYDSGVRDEAADLESLHREHYAFVWRTVSHLGVAPEAVDDAVQDVFLVVHRRLEEFEGRSEVRTWLYAIARRIAYRHRRTAQRRRRKLDAFAEHVDERSPTSPERRVAQSEAVTILSDFLDSLDDDKRDVFVLHTLEGVTGREIATSLGISVNTVHSRLRLARERFDRMCGRLQLREDRALAQLGAMHRPPTDGQRRAWALMLPLVELPADGGLSASTAWTMLEKAKIFAATVAVGTVGLGVASVATAPAPEGPRVAAIGAAATVDAPPERDSPAPAAHAPEEDTPAEELVAVVAPTEPHARQSRPKNDALTRETRMMQRLRQLVRDDAPGALDLIARADQEFPSGSFAVERQGYRAMALCNAGRDREGRGAAQLFLRDHGQAGLADQVRQICLD